MPQETTLFYNVSIQEYQQPSKVIVDKYCNGVTVVNIGATNMRINGIPLAPPVAPQLIGESYTFGGNRNEIFYGRLDIGFTGGTGNCLVIQKYYIPFQKKPFELEQEKV